MSLRKKRRISQIQQEIDRLQREFNNLLGIRKRSLRTIGPTPAGTRPQGAPRCRGRIFGCLPGAAPGECESECGLTDTKIDLGNSSTRLYICYRSFAANAVLTTVTLNLAAAANAVIMAALLTSFANTAHYQIQRPLGTNQTDQAVIQRLGYIETCGDASPTLYHYEACESLPAGAYTWSLRNTSGVLVYVYGYWMKAREVTCLPV